MVTAGVVERNGAYLVARRLRGTHLEGLWEFPGGKCEDGETHQAVWSASCVRLGCDAVVGAKLLEVAHEYPERTRSCTSSGAS